MNQFSFVSDVSGVFGPGIRQTVTRLVSRLDFGAGYKRVKTARLVLLALCGLCGDDGSTSPMSTAELADDCGMSRDTLVRILKDLKSAGVVFSSCSKWDDGQLRCTYHVTLFDFAKSGAPAPSVESEPSVEPAQPSVPRQEDACSCPPEAAPAPQDGDHGRACVSEPPSMAETVKEIVEGYSDEDFDDGADEARAVARRGDSAPADAEAAIMMMSDMSTDDPGELELMMHVGALDPGRG